MTMSPAFALRKAIRARLLGQAPLLAALGGPKLYDEAPAGAEAPYALFADSQMRDWSASLARGAEHYVTLAVISTHRGFSDALKIAQHIVESLDEAALALEGHALIDLRFVSMSVRRTQNGRFAAISILFRATTEYLN